ncbi:MAG TPA: GyrI-like domain-containing protein [Chitinophagaceae bacterium]|nr:GyrI-like domain-containing protein [Chitinophagaceae bacterium]
MKKWLGLLLLLLVALVGFNFLLPTSNKVTYAVALNVHPNAALRCLTAPGLLQKWWPQPGETVAAVPPQLLQLTYNEQTYQVTPAAFDVVNIEIKDGSGTAPSIITVLPMQHDSAFLTWTAELPQSGVAGRFQQFFTARKLQKNMAAILHRLQQFVQSEHHVYGLAINQQQVADTLLVVTKSETSTPPTVETYYELFKKLRTYIAAKGVQETNYPMLNILEVATNKYAITVAIPVNKVLPDNDGIAFKRMIPGGILFTEVRGGPGAIQEGFRQLNYYMVEHRLQQPGMAFQSLITDRLAEPNTAKWVTKLYLPVQ